MKKLVACAAMLMSAGAMAYGTGQSSFPMSTGKKLISTEFTGITSDDGGVGAQVRYTQKLNNLVTFDAGLGIGGGDRSQRLFVGADYELYPDYLNQPKISVRTSILRAEEFEATKTQFAIAPTLSKGFVFWGEEAFPYVSIPLGLNLNSENNTYDSMLSLNVGINGRLPIEGYRHLNGSLELQAGIQNSFTALVAGINFPIQ